MTRRSPAGAAGFAGVTLWLNPRAVYPQQVVPSADRQRCADLLASCGVGVRQIEAFDLAAPAEIASWAPLFALGAALGAKTVSFYNGAISERARVIESLRAACALAEGCGLRVNLEPVSFGHTRTLRQAQALIEEAGVDAGIVLDFLHHVRAGGSVRDLESIDPQPLRYVQVNDGAAIRPAREWPEEAMSERSYPGEGAFPIAAFLARVRPHAVIGLEAPSRRRTQAGMSPAQQAQALMTAIRGVELSPLAADP